MKFFLLSAAAVLLAVLAGVSEVSACACTAARTAVDEFTVSPIVLTAKIDRFDELDRSVAGTNVYRTMAAVMTVEKSYKGTIKAGQQIRILDASGGDCSRGFGREKPGQRFLIYAAPARKVAGLPGRLFLISLCSRTERLEDAAADLTFLDERARLAGKTRLTGLVKRFSQEPSSLARIRVTVSGNNFHRDVETDERGFFEIWDLPAGQYQVAYQVPRGIGITAYKLVPGDVKWRRGTIPDNMIRAVIAPRKHVEITVGLDSRTTAGQ